METLPGFALSGVAPNTVAGAWGLEYAKVIEMYDHFAGMWLDLPQAALHRAEKNKHGLPVQGNARLPESRNPRSPRIPLARAVS
jgi:hypothetical protein